MSIAEVCAGLCRRCQFPADELNHSGYCRFCAQVIKDETTTPASSMVPAQTETVIGEFALRLFQENCVEQTFEQLNAYTSTLIVMATGTGKTITIGAIIHRWEEGHVLFMVHRDELMRQACDKLYRMSGEKCDVEMGEARADSSIMYQRAKVVVTSVQTMSRRNRMQRFNPHEYGLLVIDEAHHSCAPSYLAVIAHFQQNPKLKLIGLTATPDRADERALGQVFQSVAFEYGILDAINDGWLVPIEQQFVRIKGLDLSQVRTTAGDLNQGDLAKIMEEEERCHEVASATRQLADGPTLVFAASVRQAELISEILNRHESRSSEWICGDALKCPMDMRHSILERFTQGQFRFLVNCAILLEGYDEPTIRTIVMARPTKSRSLYSQIIGRGTRPLAGTVDGIAEAEDRRGSIATSGKTALLVLDLVGNSGKHKLITTADILGGNYDDEIVAKATEAAQKASARGERIAMLDALRNAMEERKTAEQKRRQRVVADAKVSMKVIDPFVVFDIMPEREPEYSRGRPPAPWVTKILDKAKIPWDHKMGYERTAQLAKAQIERWQKHLATYKQVAVLRRAGYENASDFTFEQASKEMDYLSKNGWRKPATAAPN